MDSNELGQFIYLVTVGAIKADLRRNEDAAEKVVASTFNIQAILKEGMSSDLVKEAKHYVDWQYGIRSKPVWL